MFSDYHGVGTKQLSEPGVNVFIYDESLLVRVLLAAIEWEQNNCQIEFLRRIP